MTALKPKLLAAVVSLGILAVYLGLPTRNYYWDGIGFAQAIEDAPHFAPSLIHPNHLIYTAAGYLDYRLIQMLGIHARALTVLRVTNSILSGAVAYLFFGLLMDCSASVDLSLVLTLVLAFSATWWRFSTDANAYVPAVLLLLVSFGLALPNRPSQPALAGFTHAGAMLFHELSILFYPVMVLGLWRQGASLPLRERLGNVVRYSAIAGFGTVSPYIAAYSWVRQTKPEPGALGFRDFLGWVTSYAPDASFSWNLKRDIVLSLRSHLRLFFGGRVAWAVRQWPRFSVAMILILVGLISALAYRLMRSKGSSQALAGPGSQLSSPSGAPPGYQGVLSLITVWIGCYIVFLFFWLPGNTFYRLFYLPALILLPAIFLARRAGGGQSQPSMSCIALLAAIMAVSNLTFDIFPNSRAESNPPLEFALGMNRYWKPGTVVYYGSFNTDDWTIRYFHPETAWKRWGPATSISMDRAFPQPSVGDAWLDTTALDLLSQSPGGPEWLDKHTPEKLRAELVDSGHRMIFQKIGSGRP